MRAMFRLSARAIAGLNAPGRYADGGGLYLQVRPNGKSWIFRYRRRSGTNSKGREFALRELGLGPLASVSLAEARQKRDAEAAKLNAGLDPLADKKTRRAAAIKAKAFGVYCEEFLASALAGFKNEKHRAQWASTLKTYAKPIWSTPVDEITTADIKAILDPIWNDKRETARRVRGRIERVLSAAKAAGLRGGENPARWSDNLQAFYGTQAKADKGHHAAIPFPEMPGFMGDLTKLHSVSARALEFAILTVARTGEVRGATWAEISLTDAVWTIPASRMKAGKEHRVPLTSRALAILKAMKPGKLEALIFPGAKRGEPLSDAALLMCLRGLREGVTTHGFRSSFRDWAGDATNFPRDLAEMALAHTIKDKAEAAYRRGDALERRREMMNAWQVFLGG